MLLLCWLPAAASLFWFPCAGPKLGGCGGGGGDEVTLFQSVMRSAFKYRTCTEYASSALAGMCLLWYAACCCGTASTTAHHYYLYFCLLCCFFQLNHTLFMVFDSKCRLQCTAGGGLLYVILNKYHAQQQMDSTQSM